MHHQEPEPPISIVHPEDNFNSGMPPTPLPPHTPLPSQTSYQPHTPLPSQTPIHTHSPLMNQSQIPLSPLVQGTPTSQQMMQMSQDAVGMSMPPPDVHYPGSVQNMNYPGTPAPPTPLHNIEDMPHLQPDQVLFNLIETHYII